jgi:integrase
MARTSAYQRVVNVHKATHPISIKYTHGREWYGIAAGVSVEPIHWDKKNGLVKSTHPEAAAHNATLSKLATELLLLAAELSRQGIEPTIAAVRDGLKAWRARGEQEVLTVPVVPSEPVVLSFLYYLDLFIQSKNGGYSYAQVRHRNKQLRAEDRTKKIPATGGVYGANTIKTFYSLYKIMEQFQAHTRTTLVPADFDHNLMVRLQAYLIGPKKYLNASVCKIIKSVKRVLNQLVDDEVMPHTKYKRFVLSEKKKVTAHTVIALSKDELHTLWAMELEGENGVAYVRDLFVLGCSTGLRYSDLVCIGPSHVRNNQIHIETQKTGEGVTIPLNPLSAAILEKYQRRIRKISNQKYNEHLKTLLQMLPSMREPVERVRWSGAERRSEVVQKWQLVTSHTARRTFINVALESGVSVAVLRGWVGHANLEQLLQYADTHRNATSEMSKAFGG